MAQIEPGTLLSGKYQIVRLLGAGGMGEVYEGVQVSLNRRVAIKTFASHLAVDAEMFARFRREALAAASLFHPNIVQVTDLHEEPGQAPYMVMELLQGESLREVLQAEGRLAADRAVHITVQLLAALSAAHGVGIIHRDIKPGNVFLIHTLVARDQVKLLDFGVAKIENPTDGPLTRQGQVLGTTAYMAPEQAMGGSVDGRVDVFAVGAVLFTMLAGRKPRDDSSVVGAALSRCHTLASVVSDADPRLCRIVDKALAWEARERFATAEEMAQSLLALHATVPPASLGPATEPAPRASLREPTAATKVPVLAPITEYFRSQPPIAKTLLSPASPEAPVTTLAVAVAAAPVAPNPPAPLAPRPPLTARPADSAIGALSIAAIVAGVIGVGSLIAVFAVGALIVHRRGTATVASSSAIASTSTAPTGSSCADLAACCASLADQSSCGRIAKQGDLPNCATELRYQRGQGACGGPPASSPDCRALQRCCEQIGVTDPDRSTCRYTTSRDEPTTCARERAYYEHAKKCSP